MNKELKDFFGKDLSKLSDDDIEKLRKLPDTDLVKAGGTLDMFGVIESYLRLKDALQKEEKVIKKLTWGLFALTFVLVILTAILVYFEVYKC